MKIILVIFFITNLLISQLQGMEGPSVLDILADAAIERSQKITTIDKDIVKPQPLIKKRKKENAGPIVTKENVKRRKRNATWPCKECSYSTTNFNWMKNHKNLHDKNKEYPNSAVYQCKICFYLAVTSSILRDHENITHRDEKPYFCENAGCDFSTKRHAGLVQHYKSQKHKLF
ncbi:MAG TPA: hypothetical protein VLB80_01085 [Candidatus Babeliales bacterium]|nr:hypothetical protein [Candidatus Babeliales bacterium]